MIIFAVAMKQVVCVEIFEQLIFTQNTYVYTYLHRGCLYVWGKDVRVSV